jgi:hypothetical protein
VTTAVSPVLDKPKVALALAIAAGNERQLSDAFALLADRHAREADVRDQATLMAKWSAEHIELLAPMTEKYGKAVSERPERLRSALLSGTRVGGLGLLMDLKDVSLLLHEQELTWESLWEAAQALKDEEFVSIVERARDQTNRQQQWLKSRMKESAGQVLTVAADPRAEIQASVPKHLSLVSLPDPVWSPIAVAALTLAVGVPALLFGMQPWLLPSLGPSAFLQAALPAHPAARLYNVVVGHGGAVISGFAAVWLLNAWNEPVVLTDHVLTPVRLTASVLAMALSMLLGILLRASHPPAAATVLLITLGSLSTQDQLIALAIGVGIVGVVGELVRRLRLGQPSWGRAKAAARASSG